MNPKERAARLGAHLVLQKGESLYGVVDGAQDLELAYEAQCVHGQEMRTLFEGNMASSAADVAPYLVSIDPQNGYLESWAARWGKNAGILLISTAKFDQLHAHLRSIFIVKDEGGQEYFLRFYDPRVVRTFLPACDSQELSEFFGPIKAILAESAEGDSLDRFSFFSSSLLAQQLPLEAVPHAE